MTPAGNQQTENKDSSTASIVLAPKQSTPNSIKRTQVVVLLLIVLSAVLFFLPGVNPTTDISEHRDFASRSGTTPDIEKPQSASPLEDAEALVFRREAQDLLVEIVEIKQFLSEQHIEVWGAYEFSDINSNLEEAEKQYQIGEYKAAQLGYAEVLSQLQSLSDSFQPRVDNLLQEAEAALKDYRDTDAIGSYKTVLAMDPANTTAAEGMALATVLPQIQQLITTAINCKSRGDLNCALDSTQQAIALNADFSPSIELRNVIRSEVTQQQYQEKMTAGFLALEQQRWDSARSAFSQAERILPGQSNTALALAQTDATQEQLEVTQLLTKAAALEAQEQWDRAQKIYEKLLRRDASLIEPTVRLVVVKARAQIAAKFRYFLKDPMLLTRSKEANLAEQLLRDTASLAAKSPFLLEQHKLLSDHVSTMKTPKKIAFTSDGQTDVTVFKVAKLGKFSQTTLTLKPGKYIASGNRQGYRDVRVEFVVPGDTSIPPVSIACVDMI